MKKRIVCLFVFISLLVSSFSVTAFAASFTDFSEFGVQTMTVNHSKGSVCDGNISDSEYGNGFTFSVSKGLYLLKNDTYSAGLVPSAATNQLSYVNFDGEYVYCALRLTTDQSIAPVTKEFGSAYRVTVRLGLDSGEHPVYLGSLLTNTYYFSSDDFSCVSFYGERIARSVEQKSVVTQPLSSATEQYQDNGVVSAAGVKWNAAEYCKSAVFSLDKNGTSSVLSFEAKIPVEDVLLSVHPSRRESVRAALKNTQQALCGYFSSEIALNSNTSLVIGIPSALSADGQSLSDWMKNSFQKPASGYYVPSLIPAPLYWCGAPEKESVIQTPEQSTPSEPTQENTEQAATENSATTNRTETYVQSGSLSNSISEEIVLDEDESVFDSLPDPDQLIAEETEFVYDSKKSSGEDEGLNLASSLVALGSGLLIFASIVILCIYFRGNGKKEEASQKKTSDHRPKAYPAKKPHNKKKKKHKNKNKKPDSDDEFLW